MKILLSLSTLAMRQLVEGACKAVGFEAAAGASNAVVGFLGRHFTDHSQRLNVALQRANAQAWQALEIALAGDSLWDRCKGILAPKEQQAFRQQVQAFLDATPVAGLPNHGAAFRQQCLVELRAARDRLLLGGGSLHAQQLAQEAGALICFDDPQRLLDAETQAVEQIASELGQAGYRSLAHLLLLRPTDGPPLLVLAVRYFFRRAVEEDSRLFQGLAWAKWEHLADAQEKNFAGLEAALADYSDRLEEILQNVQGVVVETRAAVFDIRSEIQGQKQQIQELGQNVLQLLEQHQLQRRELRPTDSLSIHSESERQVVKALVGRYRALPSEQRKQFPALLHALGKLEVVTGEFDTAQRDFQEVATLVDIPQARAEAHFNAYRAALERREWNDALHELQEAVKLDGERYMPFPMAKYLPQRILGAGGFGVAFLCRHKFMNALVVVKALLLDGLDRDVDQVFAEAQVLRQLDHPAIIRSQDCAYVDADRKARPYVVMDFFEGMTLEDYVRANGSLTPAELLALARPVVEALQAAHSQGILHRDVKPANLLVQRNQNGWEVRLIDFGLALRHQALENTPRSPGARDRTVVGSSIAGTLDYAAPEQIGRLPGVAIGPYSDIYSFGKTCCFALFRSTQPLPKHWRSIPESLAALLERCLGEKPDERPTDCAAVLRSLSQVRLQELTRGQRDQSTVVDVVPVAEEVPVLVARSIPARDLPPRFRDEVWSKSRQRKRAEQPGVAGGVPTWFWCAGGVGIAAGVLVAFLLQRPTPRPSSDSEQPTNAVAVVPQRPTSSSQEEVSRAAPSPSESPSPPTALPEPTPPPDPAPEPARPPSTKTQKRPRPTGNPALTQLLQNLRSTEGRARRDAAERLARTQPSERQDEVARALEPLLDDPDPFTRRAAMGALAIWGTPDSFAVVVKALNSSDVFVQQKALELLGKVQDERAAEPIAKLLVSFSRRYAASKTLQAMGPVAEKTVWPYLTNSDVFVRQEACRILKQIGTRHSLAPLRTATRDSNALVSREAADALKVVNARAFAQAGSK